MRKSPVGGRCHRPAPVVQLPLLCIEGHALTLTDPSNQPSPTEAVEDIKAVEDMVENQPENSSSASDADAAAARRRI